MPDSTLFLGATPEEMARLRSLIPMRGQPGWIRRRPDDRLLTWLSVYELAGKTLGHQESSDAYNCAHMVRAEIQRRGLAPLPSRRIPRCQVCHHGTEKLFATSKATHDIADSNDESRRVFPNLCARCWSDLHRDSEE
jgi:hypothetical protein